jgi:predicted DNA-binding protein
VKHEKKWLNSLKKDKYLSFRIPANVEEQLKRHAEEQTRTVAGQILHYIIRGMKDDDKAAD